MASYKTHISVGFLWGIVFSAGCILSGGIDILQGIVAVVLAEIGSAVPDVDSDTARPRRIILGILGIAVPVIFASGYLKNSRLETTFCVVLFTYLFLQYVLAYTFAKFTRHRGLFHSVPMALLCAEITFLLFETSGHRVALIYAVSCGGGYLSHLVLDEFCSIDLKRATIKRSFGTALCFKGDSWWRNTLLYFLVIVSGAICVWRLM